MKKVLVSIAYNLSLRILSRQDAEIKEIIGRGENIL